MLENIIWTYVCPFLFVVASQKSKTKIIPPILNKLAFSQNDKHTNKINHILVLAGKRSILVIRFHFSEGCSLFLVWDWSPSLQSSRLADRQRVTIFPLEPESRHSSGLQKWSPKKLLVTNFSANAVTTYTHTFYR